MENVVNSSIAGSCVCPYRNQLSLVALEVSCGWIFSGYLQVWVKIKRLPASLGENLAVTFKFALYFRTIRIESLNWKLLRSCLLTTEHY